MKACLLLLALCLGSAAAEIYFQERFDDSWTDRWHKSTWKTSDGSAGEFKLSAGKWYGDEKEDRGIQTGPDSKYFVTYAELAKSVDNTGKDLVLQFSVKHEQNIDCGGGYIKLIPASSADQMASFGGETPYSIMFGPDICGFSTKKVHVILTKDGKNHLISKDIPAKSDELTHVYTLVIKPDNTYQVLIDLEEAASGSLEEDWSILPPKQIRDPSASKPDDWEENEMMDDPSDVKPAGWDDIPATIVDPSASKPEDWNDEDDGEWEAPTIANPEFKGEWKAKQIKNPKYKGVWEAPLIDNPDYAPNPDLYRFTDLKYVGFELWQVKSGSIFDNIVLTDDLAAAKAFAQDTWGKSKDSEQAMYDRIQKEESDKKAAEAEASKDNAAADSGKDDDGEYDEGGDAKTVKVNHEEL